MPVSAPRLLRALPDVFIGADAASGLDGRRGFLYGEKRHRQVDVLGFEPASDDAERKGSGFDALVERRLSRAAIRGWRVVGLAVRPEDLEHRGATLLRGLVAGDVVIAAERESADPDRGKTDAIPGEGAARETSSPATPGSGKRRPKVLVHRGDCLAEVGTRRPR